MSMTMNTTGALSHEQSSECIYGHRRDEVLDRLKAAVTSLTGSEGFQSWLHIRTKTTIGMVQALKGALGRDKDELGLLITLPQPTKGMRDEADISGSYTLPLTRNKYPRIQLMTIADYKLEVTRPKTKKSIRSIDLDEKTVAMLQEHHRQQAEEWLAGGRSGPRPSLLFGHNGAFVHPDSFSKTFKRLVAKSGLPILRLHDVRHTHASLLLLAGVHPKVVQERLGHSSISVTMDLYSHLIPSLQKTAAADLSAMVFGG